MAKTGKHLLGVFAVDPGKQTGLAWAIVDVQGATVKSALRDAILKNSQTIDGPELEQARRIFNLWQYFRELCFEMDVDLSNVHLVIEDFSLIPGQHAGGKEGVSPARVGWAFEGYRVGRAVKYRSSKHVVEATWQLPGATRNKKHLKGWDCWVVGKEHERAAFCHVGERLRKLIR